MGGWTFAGFGALLLAFGVAFILSMGDERKADAEFLVSDLDHMLETHPAT